MKNVFIEEMKLNALEGLFKNICKSLDINIEAARSKGRKRELVFARYIYFYIAFNRYPKTTLQQIGSIMSNGHHTTVIHAIKTVTELLEVNDSKFMPFWNSTVGYKHTMKILRKKYSRLNLIFHSINKKINKYHGKTI